MNLSIEQLMINNSQLSQSSSSQTTAVGHTAQTVHEISQMASQTSDNANISKTISDKTKTSASQGTQTVNLVSVAIASIKKTNDSVFEVRQSPVVGISNYC